MKVYAIWEPMIPTDWGRPVTYVLARLRDSRTAQFWDPDHRFARELSKAARDPQPEPKCCRRDGVLWDLAAVYPPGATWDNTLPPAVFFDGAVLNVKDDLESELAK
jgi:hypothetical protein